MWLCVCAFMQTFRKFNEGNMREILDPLLEDHVDDEVLEKLLSLAFQCAAPTRDDRPTMKEVGEQLWEIRKEYGKSIRKVWRSWTTLPVFEAFPSRPQPRTKHANYSCPLDKHLWYVSYLEDVVWTMYSVITPSVCTFLSIGLQCTPLRRMYVLDFSHFLILLIWYSDGCNGTRYCKWSTI